MAVKQPPHQSKVFEWTTQPNVYMDIKAPKGTTFNDVRAFVCVCIVCVSLGLAID